ncbi:MAG: hypothetical protein AAGA90_02500 [Actinomycetota bacterium]
MTDHRPPFAEFDLRQALSGQATAIRPTADPARVHDGMVRADRLRTVRAAATAGVMAIVVALGVLNLQGVEERSLVDTVDQPDTLEPDPTVPSIDDAAADDAVDAESSEDEPQLITVATTTAPPATSVPAGPDHLTPPPTTAAPVSVVSTTIPPTTTSPTTTTTTTVTTTTAAPSTTTTTGVSFTASARYGSCELDPPYDEYHGTAEPGATIRIDSPHSPPTEITAGDDGHWAVTVFFPTAPANETFTVTVSDGVTSMAFDFVHVVASG